MPFVAPSRPRTYQRWGAWAAPTLALALKRLQPYDLVHAHYAAPAGDAVRRARARGAGRRVRARRGRAVGGRSAGRPGDRRGRAAQRDARARELRRHRGEGARAGRQEDPRRPPRHRPPARAGARAGGADGRDRRPPRRAQAPCGPPKARSRRSKGSGGSSSATALSGPCCSTSRGTLGVDVEFKGQLPPEHAHRPATVFALPSVDEAFGVAYIEAMARGIPAIGCAGEAGPEEIAASGGGMVLVAARATRRRSPTRSRARSRTVPRSPRRRGRTSRRTSRGRRAGRRPSPPTRRRCAGEAGPLRHQPRPAVPRRRVRGAARARGRDVRADRRRRPPRRRSW